MQDGSDAQMYSDEHVQAQDLVSWLTKAVKHRFSQLSRWGRHHFFYSPHLDQPSGCRRVATETAATATAASREGTPLLEKQVRQFYEEFDPSKLVKGKLVHSLPYPTGKFDNALR